MADHDGISRLGDDPLLQIAKNIKSIEENWSPVAKGSRRIKTDIFSGLDRLHERRMANRQMRQWRQQQKALQEIETTESPSTALKAKDSKA